MGSMGAVITAITDPGQPCRITPQGARALGKRQTLAQAGSTAPWSWTHLALPHG